MLGSNSLMAAGIVTGIVAIGEAGFRLFLSSNHSTLTSYAVMLQYVL
jgi:hypothetical protein